MSIELRIVSPTNNSGRGKGATYTVTIEQQAQGSIEQGIASLQFSNHENGPWTSCPAIGEEDDPAVAANFVAWSAQDTKIEIQAQSNHNAWIRAAVFEDENALVTEDEDPDPSDPIFVRAIVSAPEP